MFTLRNVSTPDLTLDFSRQHAEMLGLPGERPENPRRMKWFHLLVRTDRVTNPHWAVVKDSVTGLLYRANGQHSSKVLASLPSSEFPSGLKVIYEEWETDNLAGDASAIFDTIDNPQSSRTNVDYMSTDRALYPELASIKLQTLVAVVNGIYHYEAEREGGVLLPPRYRGTYFGRPEVRTFTVWAAGYEDSIHGSLLHKAGVVAEIFADIQADQPVGEEFWRLVFTESHPDPDHESREVSRNLKDLNERPRVGQARLRKEAAKFWRRYRRSQPALATV